LQQRQYRAQIMAHHSQVFGVNSLESDVLLFADMVRELGGEYKIMRGKDLQYGKDRKERNGRREQQSVCRAIPLRMKVNGRAKYFTGKHGEIRRVGRGK
jgi:hypothetical protein